MEAIVPDSCEQLLDTQEITAAKLWTPWSTRTVGDPVKIPTPTIQFGKRGQPIILVMQITAMPNSVSNCYRVSLSTHHMILRIYLRKLEEGSCIW